MPFFSLFIMTLCFPYNTCTVKFLPTFTPNDFLFEQHADKGKDKWEIYAWAIRDIMSKTGNLEKNDQQYREKLRYETELGFLKKGLKDEKKPLLLDGPKESYSPDKKDSTEWNVMTILSIYFSFNLSQ